MAEPTSPDPPRTPSGQRRFLDDLVRRGIQDRRVLDAMRAIPRRAFVPEALRDAGGGQAALPIGERQTISQPWTVARMCELVEPTSRGRVLEIGTGSGYHAAVLSRLFEIVYSVERIAALAERARRSLRALHIENVHIKIFDGSYGWSEFAPYRAIVVTAGAPSVPDPLVAQLEEGGHLLLPLAEPGNARSQVLTRLTRRGATVERATFDRVRFVRLVGRFGWPEGA
jgi:protein-L-isoaspartate(D-aspartate) O-methyltransferase